MLAAVVVNQARSYLPSILDFPVKSRFRGLLPGIPDFEEKIPETGKSDICMYARECNREKSPGTTN